MVTPPDWITLLDSAPTLEFRGDLVRCVPKLSFDKPAVPSYLFTSGAVNRCNPAGVRCLYMGEDRDTALAEYDGYFTVPQPMIVYYGRLEAKRILDLNDPKTIAHFGLTEADFFKGFRLKVDRPPLQEIGKAISEQDKIVAIRFPSNACHEKGVTGFNFAVFPDSIRDPDYLEILGDKGPLERWP